MAAPGCAAMGIPLRCARQIIFTNRGDYRSRLQPGIELLTQLSDPGTTPFSNFERFTEGSFAIDSRTCQTLGPPPAEPGGGVQ